MQTRFDRMRMERNRLRLTILAGEKRRLAALLKTEGISPQRKSQMIESAKRMILMLQQATGQD